MRRKWLYQAKKRDKKVDITEIAIEKIPYIDYPGLTSEQNSWMQKLAKEVLILSKTINFSNEVAITCDLEENDPISEYGVALGGEFEVDVLSDTLSYHILNSGLYQNIVILHNHPSTKTFSLVDLRFLVVYNNIKLLVVITNQGRVHYILKTKKYDEAATVRMLKKSFEDYNKSRTNSERYEVTLFFLAHCNEVGLYYR